MKNLAFKCPECQNIQLKGNRCVDDGSILIECDLDIENATNQTESAGNEDNVHEFVKNVRMVSNLENYIDPLIEPDKSYKEFNLELEIPIKRKKIYNLKVCFLSDQNSRKVDVYNKKIIKPGSNILLISIYGKLPLELVGKEISYYYYYLYQKNDRIEIVEENNLLVNQKLRFLNVNQRFHFDGLVLFENLEESELEIIKNESITYHLDKYFYLLKDSIKINIKFEYSLSMIRLIKESFCSDVQYKFFFLKEIEKHLDILLRCLETEKFSKETEAILALTTMFIGHENNLNKFPNENQMKILLKSLALIQENSFSKIFTDFFTKDQRSICEMFESYLENNSLISNLEETIALFFLYFNLLEKINQKKSEPEKIDCMKKALSFGSINKELNNQTLNSLVNLYKPILFLQNEYIVILIHYLCGSNQKNLKTLLFSTSLSINMFLYYLEYLNKYQIDLESKKILPKFKEIYLISLDCLIKKAVKDYIPNLNQKSTSRQNYEVFLLKHLVENRILDYQVVVKLIYFCLIRFQSKNEYESDWIYSLIENWFLSQTDISSIDKNYGFGVEEAEYVNHNEPLMFDEMLSISNRLQIIPKNFQNFIIGLLNNRLNKSRFEHVFRVYIDYNFENLKNKRIFLTALENNLIEKLAFENKNIHHLKNFTGKEKSIQFMDKFLEKKFPKDYDPCTVFITNLVFRVYFEEMHRGNIVFSSKWKNEFNKIFDSFHNLINELIDGSIEISKLNFLIDQTRNVVILTNLMFDLLPNHDFSKNKSQFEKIKKLIEIRKYEWDHFNECFNILIFFIQFCSKSKNFSYDSYKKLLENFSKRKKLAFRIKEFCKPINLDDAFNKPLAQITYFDQIKYQDFQQMKKIKQLDQLKLVLFNHFFVNSFSSRCELKTVLKEILPKALNEWENVAISADESKIRLTEIENYLKNNFENNDEKCLNELIYILDYFKKPNAENSKIQIKRYFKLRECFQIAEAVKNLCTQFEITGKFVDLEMILNFKSDEFENFRLSRMDQSVQKLIDRLKNYSNRKNVECLSAFIESKNLIKWIRSNVKNLDELKFLVDLISLTKSTEIENSTDKYIFAKVFKEATTAYAPLIFGLKNFDQRFDVNLDEIFSLCIKVWNNLENDPNIDKKLVEIKDKVDALEEINKKRANVELSSIEQARQINENGLYRINLLPNEIFIQNIIQVHVIMVNKLKNTENQEQFDYEKLNELKSILVLLVRKGENSAQDREDANILEYFIQTFDNCIRLATVFLKIRNNGCDFFNNLTINLYSDSQNARLNNNQPLIELIFDQNIIITGHSRSSLELLNEICSKMEYFSDKWTTYVEMVRDEYHFINFFTLNQIILIKSHLESVLDKKVIDDLNFFSLTSMLHNIRQDFDIESFIQVMQSLVEETASSKLKTAFSKKNYKNLSENFNKIKQYAKENGFSIKTVKKAYDQFGEFNEKMYNYCLENDFECYDENDDIDDLTDNNQDQRTLDELTGGNDPFDQKLENILEYFIKKQNETNTFSINLSIERLAIFLEKLHESSKKSQEFVREIPGYLTHRGKPNLISCNQQRDQIEIVLSMYAHTYNAPLPSNDEVLYCNSQTTAEEVENFFRIAFRSDGKKIYTLVNIQELTYENSNKVEKFLSSKNNLNQSDNYVMVCICSTDRFEYSLLASLLVKNKVSPISLNEETLNNYVKQNLITKSVKSLAKYDMDKCTIRTLLSKQAGNGKSTFVENFKNSIENFQTFSNHVIIRIKTPLLDIDKIVEKLYSNKSDSESTIYHIDIAYEVIENVDFFIFNLAILNHVKHSDGRIWRRSFNDIYFIETMTQFIKSNKNICYYSTLNYLPRILFQSPRNYLYNISNFDLRPADNYFENCFFQDKYQRCANYLKLFNESLDQLRNYTFKFENFLDQTSCLKILLDYSNLTNPNWLDLTNFVNFMEMQLMALETSETFRDNPDLKDIITRLIILMTLDFGIPSLNIGEEREILCLDSNNKIQIELDKLAISRRWENLNHPYIILNDDMKTFTFMGIYLDRRSYQFINPNTGEFINDINIDINSNARIALLKSKVLIYDNFNQHGRIKKIQTLCEVMGLDFDFSKDPDKTYELNLDNCLKLMAIYMRLRCKKPVIIMGETGCGKTRILKFLSDLHIFTQTEQIKHLIHFKVHGGTNFEDIEQKIKEAECLSRLNYQIMLNKNKNRSKLVSTILFIDEANTTDAIGFIKEIMCDQTCNGRKIDFDHGLRIVAAVNPYRKHSDDMIKKLEDAGLGFYVSQSDSKEKLGQIPMRQLVYRVQPLPASMISLVWDFGQLDTETETKYINQMINKAFGKNTKNQNSLLSNLLAKCQSFMRQRNDECSFVSLRDVERVIKVTQWFIGKKTLIFEKMNEKLIPTLKDNSYQNKISDLNRAFVLAISVCYHSSLYNMNTRREFRQLIANNLTFDFQPDFDWIQVEILKCQHVFLDEIQLENNIARNYALLENVFMIIICIELRIPLFIVGKPGSSKSLAKSIVERSMHGLNSKSFLFQNLKETYFLNFQCSPLTKAEMIIRTFSEAASFQENNDLDKFVSVVNLDEVGLAEASESMPLKTLHPLLEDGTDSADNQIPPYQKVSVIGISNWALDPAKMNRGIFVSRSEPDISELVESAKGICKYDKNIYSIIEPYIKDIASAYLQVCEKAKEFKREFFGLRDYYSLIKMLYWFCMRDGRLTWSKLEHSIKRNFDGLDIDFLKPFKKELYSKLDKQKLDTDPLCEPIDLIKAALKGENVESNSRYLLLITENYSVTEIIQNYLINSLQIPAYKIVTVFGSSFKHDLDYNQVCNNISKIKHSMEVGNTVILLNFQNLFESLYDVLNQYYQTYAGQRYVYLGINTQRVNCLVHENFRLIILSNKESVYNSKIFPIPLINRLEKHFLNSSTMLNENQMRLCKKLANWVDGFTKLEMGIKSSDIFIGYQDDTVPSIMLYLIQQILDLNVSEKSNDAYDWDYCDDLFSKAQNLLLQCSTLDNFYRAMNKNLIDSNYLIKNTYHFSLSKLLKTIFLENKTELRQNLLQITTNSNYLFSRKNLEKLAHTLNIPSHNVSGCLLKSFNTENQFSKKIEQFLSQSNEKRILIIQCDFSKKYEPDLLFCARHSIYEKFKQAIARDANVLQNCSIILLINLSKRFCSKFAGYQVSQWWCYHVDELDESSDYILDLNSLKNKSLSKILKDNCQISTDIDLKKFLKIISHQACSMIDDTNINRTIERIEIFNKNCQADTFLSAILSRIINLQETKEKDVANPKMNESWFSREVLNLRKINEYWTLSKACRNHLETKLSPLLAFLLSKIDIHSNLDTFSENCLWKRGLFIQILNSVEFLKIDYKDMRDQKEQDRFFCKSDIFEKKFFKNQKFNSNIPFFWTINQQLNSFCQSYIDGISNKMEDMEKLDHFMRTIPSLFGDTICYKILEKNLDRQCVRQFFDLYLNDLVLINCIIQDQNQMSVIIKAIEYFMIKIDKLNIKISLPLIHLIYSLRKKKFQFFIQFSALEPDICQIMNNSKNFDNLEIESCLNVIYLFKEKVQEFEDLPYLNRNLKTLTNLSRSILLFVKNKVSQNLYQKIVQNVNSLVFLDLFLNDVCYQIDGKLALINLILIKKLKSIIKESNINFNNHNTLEIIHNFLLFCVEKAKSIDNLKNAKSYEEFIQRLNYFYLNTVETLIFSARPDINVIDTLFKVTIEGKICSNQQKLDLNQKTKKLLTQLLFKNFEKSFDLLNDYFNQFKNNNDYTEIALNFVTCVEESLLNNAISIDEEIIIAEQISQSLLFEKHLLDSTLRSNTPNYRVENLSYLAKLKFVLKILAKVTNSKEIMDTIKNETRLEFLLSNVRAMIEPTLNYTNIVFNFLIKELVRRYSFNSIRYIHSVTSLNWITPKQIIGDNLGIQDRYVLIGENYTRIKQALKSGLENNNSIELNAILENDSTKMLPYYLISIYRNFLLLKNDINVMSLDFIKIPFERTYSLKKAYLEEIKQLSKESSKSIELNMLMLQIKYSIEFSSNNLIKPLADLMISPQNFRQSFLPCMPQDTIFENYTAVQKVKSTDKPTLYACPNGHPYILFDCGKPWEITKCTECNANIGGTNHQLCHGNTVLEVRDRTKVGYCLPQANSENDNPANQRSLTPACFHILRFILHCILYFAAYNKPQELLKIMDTKPLNVESFFWNYIQKDLRIISKILNLNIDQVLILLHLISEKILSNKSKPIGFISDWKSKEEREEYEKNFADNFIVCFIKSYDNIIAEAILKLQEEAEKNDDQIQKIYFIAYEKNNHVHDESLSLYQKPNLWKYQSFCDYDVFKTKLALTKQNEYGILNYLVENDYRIKLVKNLSEMIKLINHINMGYYKKLPKHVLTNTSIEQCEAKEIVSKSFASENLHLSVQAFQNTWFNSKQYLQKYVSQNFRELPTLNIVDDFEFNMHTSLSHFLPSKKGDGLLSFVLFHYLIDTQNDLLNFEKKNDQKLSIDNESHLEYTDNLIDFNPDENFLRLIKSNFIYEPKEDQDLFLFSNIRNQFVEQFLKNKPLIKINLPIFLCSDEIDESNLYKKFHLIAKQEQLDPLIQLTIFQDFKTLEEVVDALNLLKILINYSKTICGFPNDHLSELIKKVYIEQNAQLVLKMTILDQCQMKHLMNIWIILVIRKCCFLTLETLNPFENLSPEFQQEKMCELNLSLDNCKNFSFLLVLYQIIEYCSKINDLNTINTTSSYRFRDVLNNFDFLFELRDDEKLSDFVQEDEEMKSIYQIWKKLVEYIN